MRGKQLWHFGPSSTCSAPEDVPLKVSVWQEVTAALEQSGGTEVSAGKASTLTCADRQRVDSAQVWSKQQVRRLQAVAVPTRLCAG